jgi:hypothetical protein
MLLVVLSANLSAQSNAATGRLTGSVADQAGAAVEGAAVVATHLARGVAFATTTDPRGGFVLDFLPPGDYRLEAGAEGYSPAVVEPLAVALGSGREVRVILHRFGETVTAAASAPAVETTATDAAATFGRESLDTLPVKGRDFSDLAALAPQAVIDRDERIHIAGGRGIFNAFQVDGADNNSAFFGEEKGGIRPPFTVSMAAVETFQVVRDTFSAQFGAAGGIINAVTRSGANDFAGEAFWYHRDEAMVGEDANGNEASEFRQDQFGAAAGGPLAEDRLHYFVSVDVQNLGQPTWRAFNDPTGALEDPENRAYLEQFVDLETETGEVTQTNDETAVLAKLDWSVAGAHHLTLRYNGSDNEGKNLSDSFTSTGWSNNGTEADEYGVAAATLVSLLSERLSNELIVQWSDEDRPREANVTDIPEVIIGNYDASFGQKNYLPNDTAERRIQLIDNLTVFWGDHLLRAGVDLSRASYDNAFFRYAGGSYRYASWDDFFDGKVRDYQQAFSDSDGAVAFDINYYNAYLQDEWRVLPNLTLKAGLRYELQDNPAPPQVNPAEPKTANVPDDGGNWAPRVAFALDPDGTGKGVLRGGWGVFHNTTPALLLANAFLFNGINIVRYRLTGGNPAMPSFPDRLDSAEGLAGLTPDIYVFGEGFQQPRVQRTFLGYEREVLAGLTFAFEGAYGKFTHLERKRDANLVIVGVNPDGTYRYSTKNRPNPAFGRIVEFLSDAEGRYEALTLSLRYRRGPVQAHAAYTCSTSEDNDSNERSVSTSSDYPESQYQLEGDWGPSAFDVRHKGVAGFTWDLPAGFLVSGLYIVQSGMPYTALSDQDENGDGYTTDRARWEGTHFTRNSFRQPYYRSLDLRAAKAFALGGMELEVMLDVFNALDAANRTTDLFTYYTTDKNGVKTRREDFGDPRVAGAPRQFQLGVRVRF